MVSEVTLSSIDFDENEWDKYYKASLASKPNLHEAIFSQELNFPHFTKKAYLHILLSEAGQRIQKAAQSNGKFIKPMDAGGSFEVKLEATWGGKDGPAVSVGASGEVHDNKGNYIKAEAKHDSNEGGSASASAGHHKEGKESKPK